MGRPILDSAAPLELARREAAAYTPKMPALSANLIRLLLLLALAFSGWAPAAHAHVKGPAAAAGTDQVAGLPDCHEQIERLGVAGEACGDCCDVGSCQGCSCAMACGTALPFSSASPTGWIASPALWPGPASATRARPFGSPLRPPIA